MTEPEVAHEAEGAEAPFDAEEKKSKKVKFEGTLPTEEGYNRRIADLEAVRDKKLALLKAEADKVLHEMYTRHGEEESKLTHEFEARKTLIMNQSAKAINNLVTIRDHAKKEAEEADRREREAIADAEAAKSASVADQLLEPATK